MNLSTETEPEQDDGEVSGDGVYATDDEAAGLDNSLKGLL